MKVCLNPKCQKEISDKNYNALYCSAKCRVYGNRSKKRLLDADDIDYVMTKGGEKYSLDKKLSDAVKMVLGIVDSVPNKLEPKIKHQEPITKKTFFEEPKEEEGVPQKTYYDYIKQIALGKKDDNYEYQDWENLEIEIRSTTLSKNTQNELIKQFKN
jgi:hypothetical protein